MASLQGPFIIHVVREKWTGHSVPVNIPVVKAKLIRSGFLGIGGIGCSRGNVGFRQHSRKFLTTRCKFSSSSNGNGSMAWNSSENNADYVNSSVLETDSLVIKMRDGRQMKCVHNNPLRGHLPDAPQPAIVLKMEDWTGLLLPIIVLEMPSASHGSCTQCPNTIYLQERPTIYQVVKDMIEKMGYIVKVVRITKRIHEAYFVEIHLVKLDNEADCISFYLRPSDAINIAVRCKARGRGRRDRGGETTASLGELWGGCRHLRGERFGD